MQKHFLRILQLGEHNFWKLLHNIANATETNCDNWQKTISTAKIFVWKGKKSTAETLSFLDLFNSLGLEHTAYDCTKMDVEDLQKKATEHTTPALHIICGLSEGAIDIISANIVGVCFTGHSPVNAPWAALAELALFQSVSEVPDNTLDTFRVSVLGAVDGLSQSIMESAIYAPFELFMGIPPWGDPDHYQTGLALKSGAKIFMSREPQLALDGAHLIYIDTKLCKMAAEKGNEAKTMTVLTGLDHYSWQKGFTLSAEYRDYATKDAPVLALLDGDDNKFLPEIDLELSAKRANIRRCALLACLAHTVNPED